MAWTRCQRAQTMAARVRSLAVAAIFIGACSGDSGGQPTGEGDAQGPESQVPAAPVTGTPQTPDDNTPPLGTAGTAAPATPESGGSQAPDPAAGAGGGQPPGQDPTLPPAGGGGAPPQVDDPVTPPPGPQEPAGPEDGDPNQPIVEVPGVPCGPNPSLFGLTSTNVEIGGRGVHVAYPCNKHGGAPVTFILNLHGTMPTEDLKLYQVAYFAANNLVDSHNLIVVSPKAVGSQWGREDGGADEPHLLEVVDWVYSTFAEFDIRSMWVGGHSWGSAYTATFGCHAELADKVRGLILMSGGGIGGFGGPTCSDRISAIVSMAEGDGRMPSDQSTLATSHGCDAAQSEMILMNEYTEWPNCNPGFVHANFYMLGKEHATYMDAEVVERIADLINQARP